MTSCSTYIDCFQYLRATTGLEVASLLGNKGRLSSAVVAGATSLPVTPNVLVPLLAFDNLTIFDGQNSEQVQVDLVGAAQGSSNIPLLQPLQFAHSQYAVYCTDGTIGSLADEIVNASSWIEDQCQQSLFQQVYSNEILDIPSMAASIDNQGMLNFRPRHFPITAENGITIQSNQSDPIAYDQSQIILDSERQFITVPWLSPLPSAGVGSWSLFSSPPYSRQQNLFLTITYTAGYNPIPGDIRDCAVLRTSAILARRQNPSGAVTVKMGKRELSWHVSGKETPESLFTAEARGILLSNYKRKV